MIGAGTAVITAFASSFFGVAGTLTGAAIASVIATVSTSVLRTSAERTNETLRRANQRLRQRRGGTWPADGDPDATMVTRWPGGPPGPAGGPARPAASTNLSQVAGGEPAGRLAGVRWLFASRQRALAVCGTVVLVFVISMTLITGVESAMGKPLASLYGRHSTGSTTVGSVSGDSKQKDPGPSTSLSTTPGGTATVTQSAPSPVTADSAGGATASSGPTDPPVTAAPTTASAPVNTDPAAGNANSTAPNANGTQPLEPGAAAATIAP